MKAPDSAAGVGRPSGTAPRALASLRGGSAVRFTASLRGLRGALLLAATLAASACAGGEEAALTTVALDLVERLPTARVRREPAFLDLGTAGARPFLAHGWSSDERSPGGRTFVWSDGPESTLDFWLLAPRDLEIFVRGAPFRFSGAPPQQVRVEINGAEMETIEVVAAGSEQRIAVSGSHLRAGSNRMVLRYAYHRSPADAAQTGDTRELGVAWDSIHFRIPGAAEEMPIETADGVLALPPGVQVDYYLRVPAQSFLEIDRLAASSDEEDASLNVAVQREGEAPVTRRFAAPQRRMRVDLGTPGGLIQLSLSCPGVGSGIGGGGVLLKEPRVLTRQAARGLVVERVSSGLASERRSNIVIYLVDTLRADRLGCYGHPRDVSPQVDAFAAQATVFESAIAQSPWTRPSVASLFTGLWPMVHGVNGRRSKLAPEALTLAEVLHAVGYATAGFVANGNVAPRFGLDQGFEIYELMPRGRNRTNDLNERVKDWLATRPPGDTRPLFLYVHTVEPHAPYHPGPPYRRRFAGAASTPGASTRRFMKALGEGHIPVTGALRKELLALYDGEIAWSDAGFGEFLELLKDSGLEADTVLVFLSDHGEEFHEHGSWEHGKSLYAEVLDVPFILRFPDLGRGQRIKTLVQHTDLLPTLLTYLDLPIPPQVEGRSLLPLLRGQELPEHQAIYAHLDLDGDRATAVITANSKLIQRPSRPHGLELFDRREDPGERVNVVLDRPVTAGYLEARLKDWMQSSTKRLAVDEAEIDEDLRQRLRALGYLE